MDKFELINEELRNIGFVIEDDVYTLEKVSYSNIIFNGHLTQQEHKQLLIMNYIGSGCEIDDSDNEIENSEIYGFDILYEEGFSLTTVYASNIDDLKFLINI